MRTTKNLGAIKMSSSKSSGGFKPFGKLDRLIETRPIAPPPPNTRHTTAPPACFPDDQSEDESRLFKQAMADVRPIACDHRIAAGNACKPPGDSEPTDETETLLKLQKLISDGEGFVVADTPEYVAGAGNLVSPLIVERLHRGDFAIQRHIDLHGLSVPAAQDAVTAFLKKAVLDSQRAVLIIHGRGLSSPGPPVLKTQVIEWLTRGPWRKWVMAYASARSCDGGTGATCVLLRKRPLTRRYRKKNRRTKPSVLNFGILKLENGRTCVS